MPSIGEDASQILGTLSPTRKKRSVERPATRARVPRSLWPNLRDHRKTVDRELLRILVNLQALHGWAFITDAGLRVLFCEDTGHMPGVGTMYAALERMRAQGLLHVKWLVKGGLRPDGEVATAGMWLIRVAMSRAERQHFLGRYKRTREIFTGRINHAAVFALMTPVRKVASAPPSTLAADEWGRKREDAKRRARELEAVWRLEHPS
jgi:hypothetical protein